MLDGEEELECEVCEDGIRSEDVSEFKYLGYVLNESAIDGAECRKKVEGERSAIIAIGSLFDNSGLQLECVRVFHGCSCLLLCMLVRQ